MNAPTHYQPRHTDAEQESTKVLMTRKNEHQGQPLLELNAITMHYATPVLQEIEFTLHPGEVRVLAGENGAGKSTLSKIICGIVTPLSGQMRLCGAAYAPKSRKEAEAQGVRMVLQELNLINTLTVAENLFLSKLPQRFGMIDYAKLNAAAHQCMAQIGLTEIEPTTPISKLGLGQRQMVEIAANLNSDCKLLILDEPTAMLSNREVDLLFAQIAFLKKQGVAIIYISHRLEETKRIADSITVLRDGRIVATHPARDMSTPELIKLMVGREVDDVVKRGHVSHQIAIKVENLSRGQAVKNVSFDVHGGEIFGIAGLVGSGRTEILRLIYGADKRDSGTISINGQPCNAKTPYEAVRHGIALVTEDRKEQGLLLSQAISCNITLSDIHRVARGGWLNHAKEHHIAKKIGQLMSLRAHSVTQKVGELSGGNQQKVAIGRWLHKECQVMLFDEPTRGIDVGAKFEIYTLMAQLAAQGKTLIVVSSDLVELMSLCHRIAVMSAGQLVDIFEPDKVTPNDLLNAAFSNCINSQSTHDTSTSH